MDEAEEMDRFFRRPDFSAECRGLAERLWWRIESSIGATEEDYELTEEELRGLAAAGQTGLPDGQSPWCR